MSDAAERVARVLEEAGVEVLNYSERDDLTGQYVITRNPLYGRHLGEVLDKTGCAVTRWIDRRDEPSRDDDESGCWTWFHEVTVDLDGPRFAEE